MINRLPCPILFAATLAVATLAAFAIDDAPPVDVSQILKTLEALKDREAKEAKAAKAKALQQVQPAASDPGLALSMWEEAVRTVQFDGASREATQFREWKEKEGDALKEKECQTALHLYFTWLSMSLQRSAGAKVHDLFPAVVSYVKEVIADQAAMEAYEELVKREKEMDPKKHGLVPAQRKAGGDIVKKIHDQILASLPGSVVVQSLGIETLLSDVGKTKGPEATTGEGWELSPGNVDGIYLKIIQPEYRAAKDPRIVEYWDMKLKSEADTATKSKLSFGIEKFNLVRRPQILWGRAQDLLAIGQRNRAISEMLKVIQGNPTHADSAGWIASLEQTLLPPAPTSPPPLAPLPASAPPVSAPVATPATAVPARTPGIPAAAYVTPATPTTPTNPTPPGVPSAPSPGTPAGS